MRIALVQLAVREKSLEYNRAHGLELAREAAKNHDLIVLPEVWTTGYSLGKINEIAETLDGPSITALQEIARENSCTILAGSIAMKHDGKTFNTSVAINKAGKVVNLYDKVHLFGMFNEEKFFAPGNNFNVFELDGLTCGSTICYDLRFPELYRHLAIGGAKIIFCPAEWPSARGDIWDLLCKARAAENHLFLIAVNCAGIFKGAPFYGHSKVIDPMGKVLVEGSDQEEILSVEIDLEEINKVRSRLNALDDVRKELIV